MIQGLVGNLPKHPQSVTPKTAIRPLTSASPLNAKIPNNKA